MLGFCVAFVSTCAAQQVLGDYNWRQLANSGQLPVELLNDVTGTIDGKSTVRITNTNDTALQVQLLKIQKPPIAKTLYAITGEVKYEGVQGDGYLEMWNYFAPLKPGGLPEVGAFSRTLGTAGEMGRLTGTSAWRKFMLPWASGPPTRLEINLFLPGRGTVYLGPLKLVEYAGNSFNAAIGSSNAWWSDRGAGLIGAIGGGVIGCLGSLLAWLASKGKARAFVLGTLKILIGMGAAAGIAGVIALLTSQPYAVWLLLLLFGVLLVAILLLRLRQYQRQYRNVELRRMASVDAREA